LAGSGPWAICTTASFGNFPDEQVPAQSDAYTGVMWERYIDVIEREIGADRSRLRPTATFVYDLGLY